MVPAIDQHVADAGIAHLAEGDFLGVGGHGLVNVTRQTPKRGPVLEIWGEERQDRAGPWEAVVWPTKQTKVVMVRSHTAGSIFIHFDAVEMTHGCLLA